MDYYVYPLHFVTPVHFGDVSQGGTLENTSLMFSSDSFFGACCSELSHDEEILQNFVKLVTEEQILISSLFPYYQGVEGLELYTSVPMMKIEVPENQITSYAEVKIEATKRKRLKRHEFLRTSRVQHFSRLVREKIEVTEPVFGQENTITQVNMRGEQSRPYYVGSYRFVEKAGLYIVVGFADESCRSLFESILERLGYSGIGGKRSSGWGKFELAEDPILLDEDGLYEDDKALYEMINNKESSLQMCISTCVPIEPDELNLLKKGSFKLKKRSGFVVVENAALQYKRNSYYALAEGSVCPKALHGRMLSIQSSVLPYTIYRNGCGFWIGVD